MKIKEEGFVLSELNHTELVGLARWIGIKNVTRGWPRELILQCIEGLNDPDIKNPVDVRRRKMEVFQQKYWDRIRMQAPKKVCPRCGECRDLQVIACYDLNRSYFE
jgi:hypothetical protein